MAQVVQKYKGDPDSVATLLNALAVGNDIQIIEKTFSSGEYLVIYENTAGTGQTVAVVKGDPSTVATLVNTLTVGATKVILSDTFSAGSYLVAYD